MKTIQRIDLMLGILAASAAFGFGGMNSPVVDPAQGGNGGRDCPYMADGIRDGRGSLGNRAPLARQRRV